MYYWSYGTIFWSAEGQRVSDLVRHATHAVPALFSASDFMGSSDTFSVSQLYAIIVLPNGGPDLESYSFKSANRSGWRQACNIFWQVARSLCHAEQLVSFEVGVCNIHDDAC
jgi:hypothetical protein